MTIRLAQIGCGLMAHRRVEAIPEGYKLVSCYDIDHQASEKLAARWGMAMRGPVVPSHSVYHALSPDLDPDAVIISVPNHLLVPTATFAIEKANMKHVLIEKPGGVNSSQMIALQALAERKEARVSVGFTLAYHPAIMEMLRMLYHGTIGVPLFVRARYGHGARPGYDKEWRANPALSGGGHLIDQGPHLLYLAMQVLGPLKLEFASLTANRWKMRDDSAFLVVRGEVGSPTAARASLHTSCIEAKNIFSFEVIGALGSLEVSGLGGSYGQETLIHHELVKHAQTPNRFEYRYDSSSALAAEMGRFTRSIHNPTIAPPSLKDAIAVMKIIEKAYES